MVKAYVLIETAAGKTKDVVKALEGTPGLKWMDSVTGPYQIIAIIEGDNLDVVSGIVIRRVRTTGGVIQTTTCLAVDLS